MDLNIHILRTYRRQYKGFQKRRHTALKTGKRIISRSPIFLGLDLTAGVIIPITGNGRIGAVGDVSRRLAALY
jgi:hypothetical protein